MKQWKIWGLGVLAAAAGLLAAVTFGGGREAQKEQQERNAVRIGVSVYKWDDTFITGIRTALEEQAKLYEQETGVKVIMDIMDAKENQNTQNGQVERLISLGCDVLCINIVDRYTASNIIEKAMDAQIPVVFFNREPVEEDMNRWEKLYYIGADPKESAVLQGQIAVEVYEKTPQLLDRNGDGAVSYVLLEGENSHQDSLIRTEWSIQTLKDGGVPLKRLAGGIANWERSQGSALMEQWLEAYPGQIELVLSNNDDMALGAIDAMKRKNIEGIQVLGIDGTPPGREALQEGTLLGTVACDSETYAKAIFDVACAAAAGEELPSWISMENDKYYWSPQEILTNFEENP